MISFGTVCCGDRWYRWNFRELYKEHPNKTNIFRGALLLLVYLSPTKLMLGFYLLSPLFLSGISRAAPGSNERTITFLPPSSIGHRRTGWGKPPV